VIVEMCMSRDVETVTPTSSLVEAIRRMAARHIRRLVVLQGPSIVGIVCHRDIVQAFPPHINPFSAVALDEAPSLGRISAVMKSPVVTIENDQPIESAAECMMEHHIGGLPVTHNRRLVGIITESDIFRTFSKLLSGHPGSTRITFDLTADQDLLSTLVATTHELGLDLASVISFRDGDRRLAVARVRGGPVNPLIESLWNSGHSVLNVLRCDAH